jgi:hypothetical protein
VPANVDRRRQSFLRRFDLEHCACRKSHPVGAENGVTAADLVLLMCAGSRTFGFWLGEHSPAPGTVSLGQRQVRSRLVLIPDSVAREGVAAGLCGRSQQAAQRR